ncbi:MAG: triose-phosphate isomerase [Gammaproteobacteria bacterium]|nr:triose-phosphate isomerase [Gammaproteobacteria bacterium]MDX2488462.1 triose-phosphate isomerase [Gammaproteobacteria bacterium]
MRRPLVAGNWKMNGDSESTTSLINGIADGRDDVTAAEVLVCPPYILIPRAADALNGQADIVLGAQDLDINQNGAFTGQISAAMLVDAGCEYVIVGHSERRAIYGESDQDVANKFKVAQDGGLIPVLCVGETLEERESGNTESVVARQIQAVIDLVGIDNFDNAVIAYEPVWAIGTGKTATPEMAQEVHKFIRDMLSTLNTGVADNLRLLYGGSMNAGNAESLIGMADIDGGLIGGASLQAESFLAICKAAN